jgi:hypothetical protein
MEIETVEYNGQVLQIGKRYEFSDNGIDWTEGRLVGVDEGERHIYQTTYMRFKRMRVGTPEGLGTITPVPVNLGHGKAYVFDYRGTSHNGIYKDSGRFIYTNGQASVEDVTNIRRLVDATQRYRVLE